METKNMFIDDFETENMTDKDLYEKYFPESTDPEDRKCFLAFTAGLHTTLRRARNKFLRAKEKLYQREISYDFNTDRSLDHLHNDSDELETMVLWLSIEQEMQCLTDNERNVIQLHYKNDLTDAVIASILGRSQSWVTKCRHTALGKLKKQLERDRHGLF